MHKRDGPPTEGRKKWPSRYAGIAHGAGIRGQIQSSMPAYAQIHLDAATRIRTLPFYINRLGW